MSAFIPHDPAIDSTLSPSEASGSAGAGEVGEMSQRTMNAVAAAEKDHIQAAREDLDAL